jgi:hypothetical protein
MQARLRRTETRPGHARAAHRTRPTLRASSSERPSSAPENMWLSLHCNASPHDSSLEVAIASIVVTAGGAIVVSTPARPSISAASISSRRSSPCARGALHPGSHRLARRHRCHQSSRFVSELLRGEGPRMAPDRDRGSMGAPSKVSSSSGPVPRRRRRLERRRKGLFERGLELVDADRLRQIAEEAHRFAALLVAFGGGRGEGDDRHVLRLGK